METRNEHMNFCDHCEGQPHLESADDLMDGEVIH
jgi:hypothetical protein